MTEGSETPNGEQGKGPEGRAHRSEGDLLAERRARRAAESGELALTRRAEAAEATVQTLERHVASLQQRLREAEDERARMDELIEAERASGREREHELLRAKQREYAEQQLRVETEDRLLALDRDSRVEVERLSQRLSASEQGARALASRLDGVQRQLAEAEQAAGAERVAMRAELRATDARSAAEQGLQARLSDLERRALEIQRGLDAERAARERSERLLEGMREGHLRMESLLADMKGIVARASTALAAVEQATPARSTPAGATRSSRTTPPSPTAAAAPPGVAPALHACPAVDPPGEARGAEMADALASAVERLRARAEAAVVAVEDTSAPVGEQAVEQREPASEQAVEQRQPAVSKRPAPAAELPSYRHSMSWFARRRIKRKLRRAR
jgi:hypothetical protein